MNDVLISALIARIRAGQMTIQQVPLPYQPIIESEQMGSKEQ